MIESAQKPLAPRGEKYTTLYKRWTWMKQRCQNPRNKSYHNYGGRGIRVCREWQRYEAFRSWALSNGFAENMTLDRIDNDGDYSPENCRWTTLKVQNNNQRQTVRITYRGITRTLHEWADFLSMSASTLYYRYVRFGWDAEKALFTPNGHEGYNKKPRADVYKGTALEGGKQ